MKPSLPLALLLAVGSARAQTTNLLTLDPAGGQSDGHSLYPELSADMRWVAWQSLGANLVPGDTNGWNDVFVRNLQTGTTLRASLSSAGDEGDQDSLEPEISGDGRFVTFFSYATNLVPGDTNGKPDVFVRDVVLGQTIRVSVGPGGVEADGGGGRYPTISADGRYVAFASSATNLVPGDTNQMTDVFVHDLVTSTTVRVSVDSSGAEGDGDSSDANLSPDGRYVAFESMATNLVPGDTNGVQDIFVHDLVTGVTLRASVDAAGAQANLESADPYLSDLGRFVAFDSTASNLIAGDGNFKDDIFVKDLTNGAIERASIGVGGSEPNWGCYDPIITADGHFVVYFSKATNLVASDTNGVEDIYLRDLVAGTTERVSVGPVGQQGNGISLYPTVSQDGRFIVFDSVSTNLVPGDANGQRDVFLRDRSGAFHHFCAGDGTLATACPCGNTGQPGRGCENSAATGGALLTAVGVTQPDTVRLDAIGELATVLSIFLQGDSLAPGGLVFGDGIRCTAGNLKRLYVKNASGGTVSAPEPGDLSITARSAELGDTIPPGATRWYQVYYRDPFTAFCPSEGFNVTSGIRIGW